MPRNRDRWKARAAELLVANHRADGKLKVDEVARKVSKGRSTVYRFLDKVREKYADLSA